MTIEGHRRALDRMNDLINSHDLGYIDDLYAEDIVWWYVGMPVPGSGRAELKARDAATLNAFADAHRQVDAMVVDEHGAAVRWRLTATHTGEYGGLPATGRRVELVGCSMFEFEGERVQRLFVYVDIAALARQLGSA